mgnify:FL=1
MESKLEYLREYYKNKALLIVGLNDSQGINISFSFFKKGVLEYVSKSLTSDTLIPKVINAFSFMFNKTHHIDYFMRENINLYEIKLLQIYGSILAFEKIMIDLKLPKFLSKIGNVFRFIYKVKKEDKKIKLTTSLINAEEPIIIYSSDVDDLMSELGSDSFNILKDYKEREKNGKYYYILNK